MSQKKINYQFKILYAVSMILVVCSHASGGGLPFVFAWYPKEAYLVVMFVFAAGYFYSEKNEKQIFAFLKKQIKKLIIPLYLWNVFYGVFTTILKRFGFGIGMDLSLNSLFWQPIVNGHQFAYNMASWFVVPFFSAQLLYVCIRKMAIQNRNNTIGECILILFLLLGGILGLFLSSIGINEGFMLTIDRSLYFLFYYAMGYFYKKVLEKRDTLPNVYYFGILLGVVLAIILYYGYMPGEAPSSMQFYKEGLIIPFVVALIGIAFWLRVARILEPVIGRSKIVNEIADNTYSIMVNQFIGFLIIKTIFGIMWAKCGLFSDFDFDLYKNYVFYIYLPKGLDGFKTIYLIAGIVVPIYMQKGINLIKRRLLKNA